MILLRPDCLVFELSNGEKVPCSAEQLAIEIVSSPGTSVETETIRQAAAAVLHYFRVELGRVSVSVPEFARALRTALKSLGFTVRDEDAPVSANAVASTPAADGSPSSPAPVSTHKEISVSVVESSLNDPAASTAMVDANSLGVATEVRCEIDLAGLGVNAAGSELQFFQVLRSGLTEQLRGYPRLLVCRGLRDAAKQLCAAQRWSPRCQETSDQIVQYLRAYLEIEPAHRDCVLCVL